MRHFYSLIAALVLAAPALAQQNDALVPGGRAPGAIPFESAGLPDVRVMTLNWQKLGGMYSEATGTKLRGGAYFIFYDRNPRFDWTGLDTENMKRGTSIYCELPVSAALGRNLEAVWNGMLGAVRPDVAPASDGAAIYVSSVAGTAMLKNFPGPKTKGFYAVVEGVGEACLANDAASLKALNERVNALAALLK